MEMATLEIRYLTPTLRGDVVDAFAGTPDVPAASRGLGVDPGMRAVANRLNAISPRFVTLSTCSGHFPPEIKGNHPGHIACWLADEFHPTPDDVISLISVGGVSEVARQHRRFNGHSGIIIGAHIRPLLEFWWASRDIDKAVADIEVAVRRWFGE